MILSPSTLIARNWLTALQTIIYFQKVL